MRDKNYPNTPFFSIIIPVYNRERLVCETIKSILEQDFNSFEIIIVDDGSTDGTASIIKEIKDNRIRYFYIENSERAAARNYGMKKSNGKYITYFDSDDLFLANRLKTFHIKIIEFKNPEVIYSNFSNSNKQSFINFKYSWNRLIHNNFFACGSIFLRADVAKEFKFNESKGLTTAEDWELWLRIMSNYEPVFINEITYWQLEHKDRSLNRINWNKILEREIILKQLVFDYFKNINRLNEVKLFIADRYTFISIAMHETGYSKTSIFQQILKAFSYNTKVIFRKRFWAAIWKLTK
jgi:glycosyltransferase involved in cell wall biosynthesis